MAFSYRLGITGIVSQISLALTSALVASGLSSHTLTVVGATNATPIVLTFSAPHQMSMYADGRQSRADLIVSGVLGNTNANGPVVAVPLSPTTAAIYSLNPSTGALVPVAGSGAYTSGGAAQSALIDWHILIGRQYLPQQGFAPRVVAVPTGDEFDAKDAYSPIPSPSSLARLQRSLLSDLTTFRIHVWGQATPPDPDGGDMDVTRAIYQETIRQIALLSAGNYSVGRGVWTRSLPQSTVDQNAGEEFVFSVTLGTPIPDTGLMFAPNPTVPAVTTQAQDIQGDLPQIGCQ